MWFLPAICLLSLLIPLAPLNFSFCTNLYPAPSFCLSQTLKGIAPGHSVSLLPLSALSIPLVWEAVDSKFSFLSISYCLFSQHRRCQMQMLCSQKAARVTEGGSVLQLEYKYHKMLWASSKCRCHLHFAERVTMSNREEVQCLAQGQFLRSSWWGFWVLVESSMQSLNNGGV